MLEPQFLRVALLKCPRSTWLSTAIRISVLHMMPPLWKCVPTLHMEKPHARKLNHFALPCSQGLAASPAPGCTTAISLASFSPLSLEKTLAASPRGLQSGGSIFSLREQVLTVVPSLCGVRNELLDCDFPPYSMHFTYRK